MITAYINWGKESFCDEVKCTVCTELKCNDIKAFRCSSVSKIKNKTGCCHLCKGRNLDKSVCYLYYGARDLASKSFQFLVAYNKWKRENENNNI
jgi:hypothetical protein